jgi:hypothetical protein
MADPKATVLNLSTARKTNKVKTSNNHSRGGAKSTGYKQATIIREGILWLCILLMFYVYLL